ncbi:E3 ubiquitin/ISG15 ligase TRIM25-like [Leptodactylus fuscus]|uniref:E3 ubiquitin/ISG15 ligase TRIM25-like n=1 Tax=Leptodactylus fuscus TaxID=238119 RepID=UPI003F4E88CF
MATAILREELSCSICLNVYTEPVTLRCGHNFCRECIDRVLDTQEVVGTYSCPDCREEFQDRSNLPRNITLRNIIERCVSSLPGEKVAGIFCAYCVHSTVAAIKSCLHCEASLCEEHLRVHSKSPEHVLSEPSNSLQSRKCSIHKKILEYYCTQDALCICVTCCLAGEHTGHKVEPLVEASTKKKDKLKTIMAKMLSQRAETEERVQSLEERRRTTRERASGVTETVTALFGDIRRKLDDLEKKVLRVISKLEEQMSVSVSELIQQLEVKKTELSQKMSHIEELCNTSDPLTVLKEQELDLDFCDTEKVEDEKRQAYNEKVQNIGGLAEGLMLATLHTGLADVVSGVQVGADEGKESYIRFDMNNVSNNLHVSDGYKTITWKNDGTSWSKTPERFQIYPQVLSSNTFLSGKCYVEWKVNNMRSGAWSVGMCYPSIDRDGAASCLGFNKKSWCLGMYNCQCSVMHDSQRVYLPHVPKSDRFRMCLNYRSGQMSFYELCEPIRHLHTFTAKFTEPLHVACYLWAPNISITFN